MVHPPAAQIVAGRPAKPLNRLSRDRAAREHTWLNTRTPDCWAETREETWGERRCTSAGTRRDDSRGNETKQSGTRVMFSTGLTRYQELDSDCQTFRAILQIVGWALESRASRFRGQRARDSHGASTWAHWGQRPRRRGHLFPDSTAN